MLFIQVDDRRNGGHRGRGEGRRVDHVRILNLLPTQSHDLRATGGVVLRPRGGCICQHSRRESQPEQAVFRALQPLSSSAELAHPRNPFRPSLSHFPSSQIYTSLVG